jgi:CheY-like chemotaxis protein
LPFFVLTNRQNTCDVVINNVQSRVAKGLASSDDLDSLSLLQDATEHISDAVQMIKDITDLARFDQGMEYEVKLEKVDLLAFGKACLMGLRHVPSSVHVNLEINDGGPATILSDSSVLHRILRRLLENALASTENGTVALQIGYNAGRCTFCVVDTGTGVGVEEQVPTPTGTLPRIFQRYHQQFIPEETTDFDEAASLRKKIEDGISSSRKNGIGIGLSVSYHLVLALGGDLRFSSAPGTTKFWFSLPSIVSADVMSYPELERSTFSRESILLSSGMSNVKLLDDASIAKRKFQPVEEEPDTTVSKKKIVTQGLKATESPAVLVVEDTDACAKLLIMMLTKMNCVPTRAVNGKEAVDIIRSSSSDAFNLILMDIRMPVMDGLEATRIIKHELKSKIPVIALTGDGGDEIKNLVDDIGFDEFHNKPLKRAALKEVVERFTNLS